MTRRWSGLAARRCSPAPWPRGLRGLPWLAMALWFATAAALAATSWDKRDGELPPVPALAARVTDLTGTLSDPQRAALEQRLAGAEAKTGNQVAVLIVPSTQPEAIEEYALRVAEQWKLGRKGVDNGVLFLVAKNDRRMRIEVGRGVEGSLPDVVAKRLLDEAVAPRFRSGDYAGGIEAGIARIEQALASSEPVTAPGAELGPQAPGQIQEGMRDKLFDLALLAFVLVPVIGGILRSIFGRFFGSLIGGAGTGAVAWLVTGSLLLGAIGAVIALVLIAATGVAGLGGLAHRGHSRGWRTGGWGGGGFGGGGGSSGGWSGGGGGFGGGGASGNW